MAGSVVMSNAKVGDFFSASEVLKLCASFELRGYRGVGVARVKTGAEPEILSSDAGLLAFAEKFCVEVNDMRTASIEDLRPSNAQMFKLAEQKMIETVGAEAGHAVKQAGPKLG